MFKGHYCSHVWGPWLDMAPSRRLRVGDWKKCILPGEESLFELDCNKWWGGGGGGKM